MDHWWKLDWFVGGAKYKGQRVTPRSAHEKHTCEGLNRDNISKMGYV